MRFLDFKQQFKSFNVITYQDVKNAFGTINQSQFSLWKKKGYIQSVKKGMYILCDTDLDQELLANEMNDSYISLEYALSYYQVIPEITQAITSVSNIRTEVIENDRGIFYYHKITPKLFCGFSLRESIIQKNRYIRIATLEKALFDLVYFRADLKTRDDFEALRLHLDNVDVRKILQFVDVIEAPQIKNRLNEFLKYLNARI